MKKKLFLSLVISIIVAFGMEAQTISDAANAYNTANNYFKESDFSTALKSYNEALSITKELGEDGADLLPKIEKMIPICKLNVAKTMVKNNEIDDAIIVLNESVEDAMAINDDKTVKSSYSLLSQIYLSKAGTAYGNKEWEQTISLSDKAIFYNETSQKAYLFKAVAYSETEQDNLLITAIEEAVKYAEAKNDDKTISSAIQTGVIYFYNKTQELMKSKKFEDALASCNKSLGIQENNIQTLYLKTTCLNELKRYDDAIKTGLYGISIETDDIMTKNGIALGLARAFEATNDNDNACRYYTQAAKEPNFKNEAEFKIKEVLKCK